jgi:hypothetical protein
MVKSSKLESDTILGFLDRSSLNREPYEKYSECFYIIEFKPVHNPGA